MYTIPDVSQEKDEVKVTILPVLVDLINWPVLTYGQMAHDGLLHLFIPLISRFERRPVATGTLVLMSLSLMDLGRHQATIGGSGKTFFMRGSLAITLHPL